MRAKRTSGLTQASIHHSTAKLPEGNNQDGESNSFDRPWVSNVLDAAVAKPPPSQSEPPSLADFDLEYQDIGRWEDDGGAILPD